MDIFVHCSTNILGHLLKGDPLFMHADRKAFVLYENRPLKVWGGRVTSDPCILSFLSYRILDY